MFDACFSLNRLFKGLQITYFSRFLLSVMVFELNFIAVKLMQEKHLLTLLFF